MYKRQEQIGAPLELYDRPANVFVAGFMGSPAMNLLPALVKAGRMTVAGQTLEASGLPDGPVTFGLRPDDVKLEPGDQGVVKAVEPTGSETHVQVTVAGLDVTVVSKDRIHLRPGDRVALDLGCSNRHLFNAETGTRLQQGK